MNQNSGFDSFFFTKKKNLYTKPEFGLRLNKAKNFDYCKVPTKNIKYNYIKLIQ
jgi:hypothetical protein